MFIFEMFLKNKMGCLKLSYGEKNYTGLKVVYSALYENGNSCTGAYRYGFNGKEKDDEVKGTGNQQDYGFRIYDTRLGRFLSTDPLFKEYAYYTPYQFSGNTPIQAIDRDGLEPAYTVDKVGKNPFTQIKVLGSSTIQHKLPQNAVILNGGMEAESPKLDPVSEVAVSLLAPIGEDINTLMSDNASTGDKVIAAGNLILLGVGGEGKAGGPKGGMKGGKLRNPSVEGVLGETGAGKGNITSKYKLSESELLDAGIEHVGADAKEIGKSGSGVYRSKTQNPDGSHNQFRIDNNSIEGNHALDNKGTKAPHGHLEQWKEGAPKPEVNNHIEIKKDK
jgi:RHS repeat-associated protein